MKTEHTDVVIAGGGLTGYTLAILLARGGVSSIVVEESATLGGAPVVPCDPRALSITPGTQRVLDSIDVWQLLPPEKVGRFDKIHIWDGTGGEEVQFDCSEICSPVLGYIVEQSVLQAALARQAKGRAGIELLMNNTVIGFTEDADSIVCKLADGRIIKSSLLVGADGINSRIRDLAGIAQERIDYHQKAVACIIETQLPHKNIARQRFLKDGPVAFLPLPDANRCGVVWSNGRDTADDLLALDDQTFCEQLETAFEARLGKVLGCESRAVFNLQRSRVLNYFNGHCVLVGDAAHTVHPMAGQGANMGLTDAAVLSELILHARSTGRDIASRQLLRKYERWRKTENNKMTLILEVLKNIYEDNSPSVSLLRGNGMMLLNRTTVIKNKIMKYAMGITGDVPAIVSSSLFEEFSNAG